MSKRTSIPFGFNIIGMASANLGLGLTTREFARVLIARGFPVCILDLDAGHGRSGKNLELNHITIAPDTELPYAINIFVEGAHILPQFALHPPRNLVTEGHLNVGFIWWDLTVLPEHLRLGLEFFDVLISGSRFIQSTMANHVPRTPILFAEHPMRLPSDIQADRRRFGLPQDVFVVGMGFDPHSDPARKNPFAAVEAFRQAFPLEKDRHLVIKMSSSKGVSPKMRTLIDQMQALINSDPRIHLIEETLPYAELLSLYASCDAFISLHRAEGLGLVPLEAMLLGKPVVATAWSGNLSYMNYQNSCLVAHDLIPVKDDSDFYGPTTLGIQGHWADPLPEHAAAWLKKLADDPDYRTRLGQRAQTDARDYQTRAEQAAFADEIAVLWENFNLQPQRDRSSLRTRIARTVQQDRLRQMGWVRRQLMRLYTPTLAFLEKWLLWRFKPSTRQS
ncbi:MAG: glycosyltransferase family 4 protein [Sulfuriferula multivorans]|uniref:Glycosyltransferase family 4 protein n=1 Tax=Sulfuriferula multivorans TaxID=1559896 RepID=A0A7C9P6Q6_9PROT|nr:glycosyltransferase family 4 protein [Sulfuriferula multivorans]